MSNVNFDEAFIDKIKNSTNIIDIAREYFELEKVSNLYRTKCKHNGGDNTPSLTFYPKTNSFYCFSCHAGNKNKNPETSGSDIISFIQWMEGLEWQESVIYLANKIGLPIPKTKLTEEDQVKLKLYENALERNREYWMNLEKSQDIKHYYYGRGFDDVDINKFRLGAYLSHEGTYKPAYAIMDEQGRTVGFSIRMDNGSKYVNSKTSDIFKKKELLYGFNFVKKEIRQQNIVVVVEGQNDSILCQKFGVPAVATMGTALTEEQIKLIGKYTKNVIIFFDGDKAGITNSIHNARILRNHGFSVDIINVEGFDPDDVAKIQREKLMQYIISNKMMAIHFAVNREISKFMSTVSELKIEAWRNICGIIDNEPDPIERKFHRDMALKVMDAISKKEGK